MRYASCQHVMTELSLHVGRVIVGIIATAVSCGDNYYQNCIAQRIDNDGLSCLFCLLALDKDIPESRKMDEHREDILYSKIKSNVFYFTKCQIYRIKENMHESYWKVV